jgi:hypothetical protein
MQTSGSARPPAGPARAPRRRAGEHHRLQDVGGLGLPAQVLVQAGSGGEAELLGQPRLGKTAVDEDRAASRGGSRRSERDRRDRRLFPLPHSRHHPVLG